MNWTLEVIVVPVSDLDRAKAFYADQLGFAVDHDMTVSDEMRVVQLTPPGSGCSIVIGNGIARSEPGSLQGVQLVVSDIHAAHAHLVDRGVDVSAVQVLGENPGPVEDPLDNVGFVYFNDPDGKRLGRAADLSSGLGRHPVTGMTAKQFADRVQAHASPVELGKIQRYFKTGKGQYGEGDVFIGVRMGQVFALAKEFIASPLFSQGIAITGRHSSDGRSVSR